MFRLDLPTLIVAFGCLLGATIGWMTLHGERFADPPGTMGDDVYFENIAFQLARNRGVSFDFADESWRAPYRENNPDGRNDWILRLEHGGVTTSRSPGFPWVTSVIYRFAGRRFGWVRAFNALSLVAALSLMLSTIAARHGRLVAGLAIVTVGLDFFVLRTAGMFMTEALGTAILCLAFTGCLWLTDSSFRTSQPFLPALFGWLLVGLLFGAGALVRANLNAWFLLILAGGIGWLVLGRFLGQRGRRWWQPGAAFAIGVLLVAFPWWVRNCAVTEGFAPFGTSGSFGLVGGYCDAAYQDFGNWNLDASVQSQQASLQRPGIRELPLARQEYLMGRDSVQRSLDWIRQNPEKLVPLMGMKAISHLGFYRQPTPVLILNGLLFLGLLLGCYASRASTGRWILLFLTLSVITTSLTWPHYGRYSLPIRPLIHVASAIGTVWFWTLIIRQLRSSVEHGTAPQVTE